MATTSATPNEPRPATADTPRSEVQRSPGKDPRLRPPRRDEVAVVAAIDVAGLTLTAIAAVVFATTDMARLGRWVALAALAAAALTGVITTVMFVSLLARRRAYVTDVKEVASRLESHNGVMPDASYFRHAKSLRDEAIKYGEEGLAARLDAAIAAVEERQ